MAFSLKYANHKLAKISESIPSKKRKAATESTETTTSSTHELSEEDKEVFLHCSATEQEEAIKLRLEKTLETRNNMFAEPPNFYSKFPFFYYNNELLLYDFSLSFPEKSNRLFDEWEKYCSIVEQICEETIGEVKDNFGGEKY